MKIILLNAIKEWTIKNLGEEEWKKIADKVNINGEKFVKQDNYMSDDKIKNLISLIQSLVDESPAEFNDNFAQFWLTDFAPKIFSYLLSKNETPGVFLSQIIELSNLIAMTMPNKYITRVNLIEAGPNKYNIYFSSQNFLIDLVAIIRAANSYFKNKIQIKKLNENKVEVSF